MAEKISNACCGNCGSERITFKDRGDQTHIVLTFGVPTSASLSDESIKNYGLQFSMGVVKALRELRREQGRESPIIIL